MFSNNCLIWRLLWLLKNKQKVFHLFIQEQSFLKAVTKGYITNLIVPERVLLRYHGDRYHGNRHTLSDALYVLLGMRAAVAVNILLLLHCRDCTT